MVTKFGKWIFHYRNFIFPILYLGLFIPSPELVENTNVTTITGLLLIMLGIVVRSATIGLEYIVRGGVKRTIFADKLVVSGIYDVCRNPMYLGNILLLLGFGIFANSIIFTLIYFPIYLFIYWSIIKAEEEYLIKKFGKEFEIYKQNVNAIFPSLNHLNSAFKDQIFNWKKVIRNEYNSLFIYVSGLLLLALYQQKMNITIFIYTFILSVIIYGIVKIMKYRNMIY